MHRVGDHALGLPQVAPREVGQHREQAAGSRGVDWKRELQNSEGG